MINIKCNILCVALHCKLFEKKKKTKIEKHLIYKKYEEKTNKQLLKTTVKLSK